MTLDLDHPRTPLARLVHAAERRSPAALRPLLEKARLDLAIVEGRLLLGEKPSPIVQAKRAGQLGFRRGAETPVSAPASTTTAAASSPASAPQASVSVSPAPATKAPAAKPAGALVVLHDGDAVREFTVAPGKLVLESALEAGHSLPFSCTLGGCGTCKVRLLEGDIELDEPHCLTPEELAQGYRLTCVGRPTTERCVARLERDPEA